MSEPDAPHAAAEVGAMPAGGDAWRFRVWAPACAVVDLHVLGPEGRVVEMEPGEHGYHTAIVDGLAEGATYRFRLDAGPERADPASRYQPGGVHGPSALVAGPSPGWDPDRPRRPLREAVFYEVHVGTFTRAGTFDAAIERLDDLVELGVTVVELMPVAQFPGARNWGYDGVFPYAVQDSYGGPSGLRRLIAEAHRRGLLVCLDVVYNHIGPEGNHLAEFGPYFTETHRTPWGRAINYDGPGSDEVRAFFIGNARAWLEDFHIDVLRLDAIHGIHDETPRPFLAELTASVRGLIASDGVPRYLVAESDRNDPATITPAPQGGLGFDAQWNDDFHHSVHALLTGELDGYYADFGSTEHLERALTAGFVYAGQRSAFRGRRHGAPADHLPGERFVVFVQNHDQVGNRRDGERLSTLVSLERQKLAAGLMVLSPFLPLLFMGEEYGETAPFQYFVSHSEEALIESVRTGRAREFSGMGWGGEPPDPQDEATFRRSVLDPGLATRSPHRELRALYRELIALRRTTPALAEPSLEALSTRRDGDVLTVLRAHPEGDALAVFNLGSKDGGTELPPGAWTSRLDSADARWAGPGDGAAAATGRGEPLRAESFRLWTGGRP